MRPKKILICVFAVLCAMLTAVLISCGGNSFRVEFYVDGELYDYFLVEKDGYIEEIPDVPVKEGKSGVWSETNFDEITSDMTVYAIYSDARYVVRFMVDGELYREIWVNKNSALTSVPSVPEKTGYRGAWTVTDFTVVDRNLTVDAVYTAVASSVTFVADGETVAIRYAPAGEALSDVPEASSYTDKNYSAKWVTDPEDGSTDADFGSIEGDTTVYAYYYITLTLSGGFDAEYVNAEIGESVALPSAGRRPGYDFAGWYTDEDYREKYEFPVVFDENASLCARWLSSEASGGFIFADGAVTGYEGEESEVTVPYKYTSGGEDVFVTKIADGAFVGSDFTRVVLPSTIAEIGAEAFRDCAYLIEVGFADGSYIERIGERAFYGCGLLSGFGFSPFTIELGDGAFDGCSSAADYDGLGESALVSIGDGAFYGNVSCLSFVLPASLVAIGAEAFYGAAAADFVFKDISLLETVGAEAFFGCVKLVSFVAPALRSVGDGTFSGCYSLASATVTSDKKLFTLFGKTADPRLYPVADGGSVYYVPVSLHNVTVTPNERSEGLSAGILISDVFRNCSSVKKVVLSRGIRTISKHAFYVDSVTGSALDVTLPSTLTEIEEFAFEGREDLRSLSLPLGLERIGAYAFYGLKELSTVTLGANNALTFVGEYAFGETAWLAEYPGVARIGRVALGISDAYIASVGKSALNAEDFEGIDTIAPYAFAGNDRILSAVLPDGILEIGEGAFSDASALTDVSLGLYCRLGEGVFNGCNALTSIALGAEKRIEELFGTEESIGGAAYVYEGETYWISPVLRTVTVLADSVRQIEADVYCNFPSLERVILGEGFTRVFDGAFRNNGSLTEVSFPSSLAEIGYREDEEAYIGVFEGSPRLSSALFPADGALAVIYPAVFRNTALSAFAVPAGTESIGAEAFLGTALSSLEFAEGERTLEIGERAFYNVRGFVGYTLHFPSRLRAIGREAFASCAGLTGVRLNEGLETLSRRAFASCGIINAELPLSVRLYEENGLCAAEGVFEGNPVSTLTLYAPISAAELFGGAAPGTLTEVTINGGAIADGQFENAASVQLLNLIGVTAIGHRAFYGCAGLTRVIVPATVGSIGDYAFASCTSLVSFVFEEGSSVTDIGEYLFAEDVALRATSFPASVEDTEFVGVFDGCISLTEANIPESVTLLGENAFRNCSSLTSVEIPSRVVTIGPYAFYNCAVLEFENIKFEDLESLGAYAFAGCALLNGVKAENIADIGEFAFDGCAGLKELTVIDKRVSDYISDVAGVVTVNVSSAAETVAQGVFDGCENLSAVMVYSRPSGINAVLTALAGENIYAAKVFVTAESYAVVDESIKNGALGEALYTNPTEINGVFEFYEETMTAKLISAEFNGSVLFLPTYAYLGGAAYEVTEIGENVFRGNKSVREIIIPFTVEKIGNYAFRDCSAEAVRFEIGSRLIRIGVNAFYGCDRLKGISLPDSLEVIEDGAFYGATSLTRAETTIYSRLVSIGKYAFYGTESLIGMEFNGAVREIAEHAFEKSGIQYLRFGPKVEITELKAYSFADCYNLKTEAIELPDGIIVDELAFAGSGL